MTILEEIKAELKAFDEKRKALIAELRTKFPDVIKPLFQANPFIDKLSWHQYTPYWQDGDTCEFSAHTDASSLSVNGYSYYERDYSEHQPLDVKYFKQFSEVLSSIPEDFLKDIFGDHSEITIHSDGTIEVTEYEHG